MMTDTLFDQNDAFDRTKDIYFNLPLHIDLEDNGGTLEFKSFYEAGCFAYGELQRWIGIIGSERSELPFLQRIIDLQLRTPRAVCAAAESVLRGEITGAEGFSVLRREFNNYLSYKCIHSAGKVGRLASIFYHYEPMIMGFLAGASGSATLGDAQDGYENRADVESFSFGFAFTMGYNTDVTPETIDIKVSETLRKINHISRHVQLAERQLKPLEVEQEALQQNIEEARSQLQTYRTEVSDYVSRLVMEIKQTSDSAVNEMWNQLNLIQNDHERQLSALRQTVSSRIRYGTALDYWNAQFKENQTKANQMTAWYIISGLFSITIFTLIAFIVKRTLTGIGTVIPALILTLPLIVAGGLVFLLLRSRSRYEKAAAQAQEKVNLLETLASLETEEKVQEGDRAQILENVFKTTFSQNSTPAMAENEAGNESSVQNPA